jgi:hypothetical protein
MRLCFVFALLLVPLSVAGQTTAGLGFSVGLAGELEQDLGASRDPDKLSLKPALTITPWMERKLQQMAHIGGELNLMWIGIKELEESRFTLHPALRTRLSFPIYNRTSFDGTFAVGPSIWFPSDELAGRVGDTRFGLAVRFGFGVSHPINRQVSTYSSLGYFRSMTFGDDSTISFTHIPFIIGLRSAN